MHADFLTVAGATRILSARSYSVLDKVTEMPGPEPTPESLLNALRDTIYTQLYSRPLPGSAAPADAWAQRVHLAAVSAANTGCGTWEPGWTMGRRENDGRIAVSKGRLTLWVPRHSIRRYRGFCTGKPLCRLLVPKELRYSAPGYYVAVGNGSTRTMPEPIVRLYWHIPAAAAAEYVATVTANLNARNVAFRTKVLLDPGMYRRADAAILYMARRDLGRLRDALRAIHAAVRGQLRPDVPMFTKALAPGVGLAEDPQNGLSFGQHRCQLVAQGLWRTLLQGACTPEARADTVAAVFKESGRDPRFPHLEPRSRDSDYLRL